MRCSDVAKSKNSRGGDKAESYRVCLDFEYISFIRPMRRRLVPADGLVFQSLRGDDTPQFVGVVPPSLVKSTTEKIRVIEACEPGRRTGQRRAEGRWLVLVIPRGAPRRHRLCYYY